MNEAEEGDYERLAARFRLDLRCEHCVAESQFFVDVPRVDDAPTGIDELLESAFLERQRFVCSSCANPIGLIAGVVQLRLPEACDA
ncbi:hypothetical protein NVS89_22660 [Ancylobacter sp. MQZ15Z-1]|uniref:Uncharacterized protein n=1 Tax=Ancylobacter mangrovi TaxID=2972472 RepID=A0A9X2PMI7_9HYPH|nr:hypothetical protein [Ancylobacter mangrovi]MCS0497897.1 hypothetical protein [Ancylobacter mangrovi]